MPVSGRASCGNPLLPSDTAPAVIPGGAAADCATHHLLTSFVPTRSREPCSAILESKPQKAMTMTAAQIAARRHEHDQMVKRFASPGIVTSAVENRPNFVKIRVPDLAGYATCCCRQRYPLA